LTQTWTHQNINVKIDTQIKSRIMFIYYFVSINTFWYIIQMPCGPSPPPCLNMQWGVPLEFVETDTHKHPHAEILKNDGSQGELRWYTIWGMCHNKRGPSKQTIIKNRRQNQVKIDLKSLKMTFGGVWSGLGGRLEAMLATRGAQEPQHVRKPHSRSSGDHPLGDHFRYFLWFSDVFLHVFFAGCFGGLPGAI